MVEVRITVRFPDSQLSSLNPQLYRAASRLTVNSFGSQTSPTPRMEANTSLLKES